MSILRAFQKGPIPADTGAPVFESIDDAVSDSPGIVPDGDQHDLLADPRYAGLVTQAEIDAHEAEAKS